jgi:MoaA/NifB/PqqE/SkfB family radical SAM enzyme
MRLKHLKTYFKIFLTRYANTKINEVPFLFLSLVDRCNSPCKTCTIWKNNSRGQELSLNDYQKIAESAKKLQVRVVSFGGGEPTLRPDLPEIIKIFKNTGVKTHINTNGTTLSAQKIDCLSSAGLDMISISLDAIEDKLYKEIRGLDALKRVLASIKYISKETSLHLSINYVVSALNDNQILPFTKEIIKYNIQKLKFIPASNNLQQSSISSNESRSFQIDPLRIPQIKKDLLQAQKLLCKNGIEGNSIMYLKHFDHVHKPERLIPCYSGHLFTIIDAYGEVKSCYEFGTKTNIKDHPLEKILNMKSYSQARQKVNQCKLPCHDVGSTEASIRMYPPYIIKNLPALLSDIRLFLK